MKKRRAHDAEAAMEKAMAQMNELSNEVKALRHKLDGLNHTIAKEKTTVEMPGWAVRKIWAAHEEDSPYSPIPPDSKGDNHGIS